MRAAGCIHVPRSLRCDVIARYLTTLRVVVGGGGAGVRLPLQRQGAAGVQLRGPQLQVRVPCTLEGVCWLPTIGTWAFYARETSVRWQLASG